MTEYKYRGDTMNGKQLKEKFRAKTFSYRQVNRMILTMDKSFGTVKKTLNNQQPKKK